jgi:hypothetical protein
MDVPYTRTEEYARRMAVDIFTLERVVERKRKEYLEKFGRYPNPAHFLDLEEKEIENEADSMRGFWTEGYIDGPEERRKKREPRPPGPLPTESIIRELDSFPATECEGDACSIPESLPPGITPRKRDRMEKRLRDVENVVPRDPVESRAEPDRFPPERVAPPLPPPRPDAYTGTPKKRGRPKGSKNKPKVPKEG